MKFFVTGGAGYIGSVTTEVLLDEGHEVTVFDNLEKGHREAVDERAAFVQGDLRNEDDIQDAMESAKPDAVMHFAAFSLVGESMEKPELYFHNNILGGMNLAQAMLDNKVKRIVFSSTCATYGEPDKIPMTEETPQQPTNPYGESKLALEKILTWHQQLHEFEPVFLRYFNACGASEKFGEDHDPESHLIPLILQVAQGKRDKIMIFGDDYETEDGTGVRDYIHIIDLAKAHLLALTTKETGAFNLGNGSGYSVKQVIEAAREVTGHEIPAEVEERRPGDPPTLIARADKARDVLGWEPEHPSLEEIIESAWKWHQAHPNGYGKKQA